MIGAGGVATVAAFKIAQNTDVFTECSVNCWMKHRLVITSVLCCVVFRDQKSFVDRFWLNQVL